ncbi:hypothetical protein L249_1462 [Ophiocordyceps polyrhachis-furcata BCC 54312]|uniref:catechol O-methyltransferase n=1 Tax=Ophiocordyceps polyrhachis-furcata BCC 54312 TaxID=1330021 RepID=A0A367L429_9HYPO|nr:hypothetical protein L249_1462 [Ophiocordyceps polyrhachis-furcata BCC 54312]
MAGFEASKAYVAQEDVYYDDGREVRLLHHIYSRPDLDRIRGSPEKVLDAIDHYGRTVAYLMNVGEHKGDIVRQLILETKPEVMVELGGYVGYSAILFGAALQRAGGRQFLSLERNPEFAAVASSLVDLAGLSPLVKVVVGPCQDSIRRLHSAGQLRLIGVLFLDHWKPAYVPDLKLCEQLGLIQPGSVLAADNVIKPGNPPYLEYVRSSVQDKKKGIAAHTGTGSFDKKWVEMYEKREGVEKLDVTARGDPCLVYTSKLVESFEPTGVPVRHCGDFVSSTTVIVAVSVWNRLTPRKEPTSSSSRKTVLVTGVGMSKGLCLARLFHRAGHRVIGADCSALSPGRVSAAVDRFRKLPKPASFSADESGRDPYVLQLLEIVRSERVQLWVSVSDVSAAAQDAVARDLIEDRTTARAVQLTFADVQTLHDKDSFMRYIQSLGLPTPDTDVVASRAAVVEFLMRRGGLELKPGAGQYLLKPIGVNDLARFNMPLLPLSTTAETMRRIDSIPMDGAPSFIMQEFVSGPEFCTHALVIRGRVRAFVACPSSGLLMHYEALPRDSQLSKRMLALTETVAKAGGPEFTGHLSFDFILKAKNEELYPIECNPRVHTAIVLFNDTPQMVDEYLTVLEPASAGSGEELSPNLPRRYYWIGQDLVQKAIGSPSRSKLASFVHDVRHSKDGTFEAWDPWPWWLLYHVYWPLQFIALLVRGERWTDRRNGDEDCAEIVGFIIMVVVNSSSCYATAPPSPPSSASSAPYPSGSSPKAGGLITAVRVLVPAAVVSVGYTAYRIDWHACYVALTTGPNRKWRWMQILLALLSWKSLPLVWTWRIFYAMMYHSVFAKAPPHTPRFLFKPMVNESHVTLLEMDYNLHKSNSTFFTDLDCARTHLVSYLCRRGMEKLRHNRRDALVPDPTTGLPASGPINIMLGSVACSFRREVGAFTRYEMWSRIIAWDRKWLYILTHFVPKGTAKPAEWLDRRCAGLKTNKAATSAADWEKKIQATALSKYVFKLGRLTVHPAIVLERSGLLPHRPDGWISGKDVSDADDGDQVGSNNEEWHWHRVEAQRKKGMEMASKFQALEDMHDLFDGGSDGALGRF